MHIEKRTNNPLVVIVGGGFGGIELAKKLKEVPVEILLIDRNNYHTFQPLLYQVATGALEAETIAFPIRRIFQSQPNFRFLLADVLKIHPENNTIETSVGEVTFDYLVLATGATTNYFGNDQLQHFTMGMKSVSEALNLRSMILESLEWANIEQDAAEKEELMTFVIVGGGPTGVELAGALAELRNHILQKDFPALDKEGMRVFVVESKPRVLGVMSEEASASAKKNLENMGVVLLNGVRVTSFNGELLTINDGTTIRTRNVIWAAGVIGEVPEGLPADKLVRGNMLATNSINRVKGYDNIFAIGDVAAVVTKEQPNGYPGVAQVAIQQGRHLAKNIAALVQNQPTTPFVYNDKGSLATIGTNKAVADLGKIKLQGFIAWIIWGLVHLWSLVGFTNRIFVFISWIRRYLSRNTSNRIILKPFKREVIDAD